MKHYFWAHFAAKKEKENFEFFDKNHGLTPWKNVIFGLLKSCNIFTLK